jgi:hypothetical protein
MEYVAEIEIHGLDFRTKNFLKLESDLAFVVHV